MPSGAKAWRAEAAHGAAVGGGCRASKARPTGLGAAAWEVNSGFRVGNCHGRGLEQVRELTDLCFRQTASSPLQTGSLRRP